MGWEASMVTMFEDLEQQAAGLRLAERDAEVAELTLAEYSRVSLGARLHASLGHDLRVRLVGGLQVSGRLARVGDGWLLLVDQTREWIVRDAAIASVAGQSSRADNEDTWSVVDTLGLRVILRRLASDPGPCVLHFVDQQQLRGRITRVGQDFVELVLGEGPDRSVQLVPTASLAALQGEV